MNEFVDDALFSPRSRRTVAYTNLPKAVWCARGTGQTRLGILLCATPARTQKDGPCGAIGRVQLNPFCVLLALVAATRCTRGPRGPAARALAVEYRSSRLLQCRLGQRRRFHFRLILQLSTHFRIKSAFAEIVDNRYSPDGPGESLLPPFSLSTAMSHHHLSFADK